jgi:hypothetical protein
MNAEGVKRKFNPIFSTDFYSEGVREKRNEKLYSILFPNNYIRKGYMAMQIFLSKNKAVQWRRK